MRLSCNGCRVLRKGCTDACAIRPCLQWLKSPDAQANATVFLAKFYGRAGLLNLLAAAPSDALRPAVFRSLLYEACGRIVNPVYGAVGLLWSGSWQLCQDAVEAVLKGAPIIVLKQAVSADDDDAADAAEAAAAYDIRHVFPRKSHAAAGGGAPQPQPPFAADDHARSKDKDEDKDMHTDSSSSRLLLHNNHKVINKVSNKPKFKRTSSSSPSPSSKSKSNNTKMTPQTNKPHAAAASSDDCDRHSASASASLDTQEAASHVSQAVAAEDQQAEAEQRPPSMGLDLTLGLVTSSAPSPIMAPPTTPAGACTLGRSSSAAAAADEPAGVIGFRFL